MNGKEVSFKNPVVPICSFVGQAIIAGALYDCFKCVVGLEEHNWCEKVIDAITTPPQHEPGSGCDTVLGCNPPVRKI